MSERDELEERLARALVALDEAQGDYDDATADLDAFIAAHSDAGTSDETGPPA